MSGSGRPKNGIVFAGDLLPVPGLSLPQEWDDFHVVANLEGCIASSGGPAPKAHTVLFDDGACERIAALGVSAVSLANNHVYDAGPQAFLRMTAMLRDVGVAVFGLREAPFVELQAGGRRCAVVGCLERCRSRGEGLFPEEQVESLVRQLKASYDHVFVLPHWGKESEFTFWPAPWQVRRAARWLAAGAEAVLGSHPHVLQGRLVVGSGRAYFSLGNLCFPHEESLRYQLTDIGLAVAYDLAEDAVRESFLIADRSGPRLVPNQSGVSAALCALLEQLSADIGVDGEARSALGWASAVGSTYVAKSRSSWALRAKRWPIRTALLRTMWRILPRTLLLHWGARHPAREVLDRARRMAADAGPAVGGA